MLLVYYSALSTSFSRYFIFICIYLFFFKFLEREENDRIYLNIYLVDERDLSALDGSPAVPLPVAREHTEHDAPSERLDARALAVVGFWLRSPREEDGDILGHLRRSGGSAIFVVNRTVNKLLWHANSAARKVGVVVEARAKLDALGRIVVPREERKQVILTPCLALTIKLKSGG